MVFDGAPGGESARRGKLERDTFTLTETTQLTHQELGGLYSVPSLCLYGHVDVTFSCASWPTASIRSTSYWKWFSLRTFFCTECSWSLNGCGTERLCYVCAHPQYPMRTMSIKVRFQILAFQAIDRLDQYFHLSIFPLICYSIQHDLLSVIVNSQLCIVLPNLTSLLHSICSGLINDLRYSLSLPLTYHYSHFICGTAEN